jgi:tetratricopeptide (TPR) repeat protein
LYRPGLRNAVNKFIDYGEQDEARALLDRVRPLIPNDAVFLGSEAVILLSEGELAEGLKLAEAAQDLSPSDSVARITVRFGLMDTAQWERVVETNEGFLRVFALAYLGRTEEASILAYHRAEEDLDITTLFGFLNLAGRSDEVISYLEERWPSLDALQQDFPPYAALGYILMLDVALAYSRAGNQQRFDDAMQRVRSAHKELKSLGADNVYFLAFEAEYQALSGDFEASLEYLERAVNMGLTSNPRMSKTWPALQRLEGDPRYEAIQARMVEHLNGERVKLGLEPVST